MKLNKALTIGAAALALTGVQAKPNILPETTENTKKNIKETIARTPSKGEKAISYEEASKWMDKGKLNKNQGEVDKIIELRNGVDNVNNIEVDEKLRYVTFNYKGTYQIKYEPKPKNGEPGSDNIYIMDSLTKKECKMEIGKSLFLDNLKAKDKKPESQNMKVTERLNYVTKIFDTIHEKIESDTTLQFNHDEIIYIKWNKIYFAAEKKIIDKKGREDFEECYFMINYEKEKKEWEITIAENFITKEINENTYLNNAFIGPL